MTKWIKANNQLEQSGKFRKLHHFTVKQLVKPGKDKVSYDNINNEETKTLQTREENQWDKCFGEQEQKWPQPCENIVVGKSQVVLNSCG